MAPIHRGVAVMNWKALATIACLLLLCSITLSSPYVRADAPTDVRSERSERVLVFDESGEAQRPRGYRSWVHVSTAWEPITTTILDGTVTRTPEFNNVYIEPNAFRGYMKTGKWPDGSVFVKEFSFTSIDAKCDGPDAYICPRWYGKGIFQHGYTGIGVMLKDKTRFPDEPGNWGYFSYGHQAPPYAKTSPVRGREQCAQCHIDHAGPSVDYVFSAFHVGLRRDGEQGALNIEASLAD